MAGENEPAKLLLPYLQRADELQKHEPLVAYYCRLYAMERGLKIPQSERTKTTNSLLVSLMNQLEKDKKSLQLGPDDHLHLEGFAMNVFSKADKQDRAGKADLPRSDLWLLVNASSIKIAGFVTVELEAGMMNTAKTFYAASIFFEIINQFGELQPDLEQKQKYAAWKAADIRKALKEGRKPVPGPPGGEKDLSVPPSTSSGEYDLESRSTDPALQDLEQRRTDVPFQDIEPRSDTIIRPSTGADYPPQPGSDAATRPTFESDSSPQTYDTVTRPTFESDSSPQTYDTVNFHHSANIPPPSNLVASPSSNLPPSPYPADDYPSHTFHQPPSTNGSENYSQFYHQQAYRHEAQQHYPSHDVPSYSYPHFQSYPSFTESSLPTAPSHYPSQYQGSDASYSTTLAPSTTNYASGPQYNSAGGNGSVSEPKITAAQTYHYDSSYQPPPEKIAEAHKAARFAVGALAFDDVSVAVDYLKKSLELLTLPSAGH